MDGYCLRIHCLLLCSSVICITCSSIQDKQRDVAPQWVETNVNIASLRLNIIMTCAWAVPATCACNSRRWSRCTAAQAGRTPRPAAARTPCWGKAPQSLLFFLKEKRNINFTLCSARKENCKSAQLIEHYN